MYIVHCTWSLFKKEQQKNNRINEWKCQVSFRFHTTVRPNLESLSEFHNFHGKFHHSRALCLTQFLRKINQNKPTNKINYKETHTHTQRPYMLNKQRKKIGNQFAPRMIWCLYKYESSSCKSLRICFVFWLKYLIISKWFFACLSLVSVKTMIMVHTRYLRCRRINTTNNRPKGEK